jgi:energy-coupling factor transport system ATP-binding protein
VIRISNLSFSYDSTPFIENLNLQINSGDFVIFLGKNGSGKSTLIKLILGIEKPSKGEIFIDNISLEKNIYEARKIMGLVFQNPDEQIVSDTVETDIAFALENYGYSSEEINKHVDRVLDLVGLKHRRKDKISTLSGGEKQRVCIASAMVLEPKILILDEATSMLDTANRINVMNILKKINDAGVTIIMVSHHLSEIQYTDRVVFLEKGISFDGKKECFIENLIKGDNFYNLNLPPSFKIACEVYKKMELNLSKYVFSVRKVGEIICESI